MRTALAVGAMAIAVLVPAEASASHSRSAEGKRDLAVGAGSSEFALGAIGQAGFSVGATSDPFGGEPVGYVTSRGDPDGIGPMEPFTAKGEITCLRVEGNRASIKWRLNEATGSAAPFEGGGVQSFLEDNGEPRFGQPLDRAAIDPPQPAATFDLNADQCEDPSTRPTYDPLESGNITIHDAAGS